MLGVSEHSNGSNKAFKRSVAKLNLKKKEIFLVWEQNEFPFSTYIIR